MLVDLVDFWSCFSHKCHLCFLFLSKGTQSQIFMDIDKERFSEIHWVTFQVFCFRTRTSLILEKNIFRCVSQSSYCSLANLLLCNKNDFLKSIIEFVAFFGCWWSNLGPVFVDATTIISKILPWLSICALKLELGVFLSSS